MRRLVTSPRVRVAAAPFDAVIFDFDIFDTGEPVFWQAPSRLPTRTIRRSR